MSTSAGPASALSASIVSVVDAVRAADPDAFEAAQERLLALDVERVGIVQAAAIRSLLEERCPDGLDADDVRTILTRTAAASAWLPDFDAEALLVVLTGALGMVDPETTPAVGRGSPVRYAAVLLADLSSTGPDRLGDHLTLAIDEIRRAETMEMP